MLPIEWETEVVDKNITKNNIQFMNQSVTSWMAEKADYMLDWVVVEYLASNKTSASSKISQLSNSLLDMNNRNMPLVIGLFHGQHRH